MQQQKSLIIYDGDCMLCHSYVRMVRLREAIGEVETLDARSVSYTHLTLPTILLV